ncbi:MAG TPA: polyprenyl synthetase family protein [Actinomycetota bacterium]|nr:polyprenyl synthetase family protein [Actinomycetota bacterium]
MPEPLMAERGRVGLRRTGHDVLAGARAQIDPALRAVVQGLPAGSRHVVGYHFGWWDELGITAAGGPDGRAGGGKVIRPALALLAAEAAGGHPGGAVPAAVALELVHNFSLVHDDLIDGDATRRHRPTVWAVFGPAPALLAGDALLSLAFEVLAACGHPAAPEGAGMLGAAVQALIDGQTRDMSFEARTDVDVAECRGMAERKTGALFGAACGLGALFGGGSPQLVSYLRGVGERLGLAFQFVDDLLGIWGDPAVTGKPVYSDLSRRKKSLPVVWALRSGTDAGAELAALFAGRESLAGDELARSAQLVELAGGREWSVAQVDELLVEVLVLLDSVALAERPAAELGELARLMTRRDR